MKNKPANHKSYRAAADNLFMPQFRGLPCEVCGKTEGTAGHHIVRKGRCKALRYDAKNIIVLCQKHHTMGNGRAAHSLNQMACARFQAWLEATKPEQWAWCVENERLERRYTYKQAVDNMRAGRDAWEG